MHVLETDADAALLVKCTKEGHNVGAVAIIEGSELTQDLLPRGFVHSVQRYNFESHGSACWFVDNLLHNAADALSDGAHDGEIAKANGA